MTTQEARAMDRAKVRANHARIKQVPCPRCGAPKLAPCRQPEGGTTYPHQARRRAAAEAGVYVP